MPIDRRHISAHIAAQRGWVVGFLIAAILCAGLAGLAGMTIVDRLTTHATEVVGEVVDEGTDRFRSGSGRRSSWVEARGVTLEYAVDGVASRTKVRSDELQIGDEVQLWVEDDSGVASELPPQGPGVLLWVGLGLALLGAVICVLFARWFARSMTALRRFDPSGRTPDFTVRVLDREVSGEPLERKRTVTLHALSGPNTLAERTGQRLTLTGRLAALPALEAIPGELSAYYPRPDRAALSLSAVLHAPGTERWWAMDVGFPTASDAGQPETTAAEAVDEGDLDAGISRTEPIAPYLPAPAAPAATAPAVTPPAPAVTLPTAPGIQARVPMRAYNIEPRSAEGAARYRGAPVLGQMPGQNPTPWGWFGELAPAIHPRQWPLSSRTRLPMRHITTMRLPGEYQRKGTGLPGIAIFAGQGQFSTPLGELDPGDPLAHFISGHDLHPQQRLLHDDIGHEFALLWLSEAELTGRRLAPPADVRRPGEHLASDQGLNAWDPPRGVPDYALAEKLLFFSVRDDPNAGIAPVDVPGPDSAYQDGWESGFHEADWCDRDHLGGSLLMPDGIPPGMSPWFLSLQMMSSFVDYGNGEATIIDLEHEELVIG